MEQQRSLQHRGVGSGSRVGVGLGGGIVGEGKILGSEHRADGGTS